MLDNHDTPMRFHEAITVGRRLSVVFLTEEPIGETEDGPIFGGGYFSNSEAGECGVRGTAIVQLDGDLRGLAKLHHLAHSGRDFLNRLSTMLNKVLMDWELVVGVAGQAQQIFEQPLKLLSSDRTVSKSKRARLRHKVAGYVDKSLAEEVVRKVIFMGADGDYVPAFVNWQEINNRRLRDLTLVLMHEAHGQYPSVREQLETAAFDVLAGKLHL
jgi:hypothetical protein